MSVTSLPNGSHLRFSSFSPRWPSSATADTLTQTGSEIDDPLNTEDHEEGSIVEEETSLLGAVLVPMPSLDSLSTSPLGGIDWKELIQRSSFSGENGSENEEAGLECEGEEAGARLALKVEELCALCASILSLPLPLPFLFADMADRTSVSELSDSLAEVSETLKETRTLLNRYATSLRALATSVAAPQRQAREREVQVSARQRAEGVLMELVNATLVPENLIRALSSATLATGLGAYLRVFDEKLRALAALSGRAVERERVRLVPIVAATLERVGGYLSRVSEGGKGRGLVQWQQKRGQADRLRPLVEFVQRHGGKERVRALVGAYTHSLSSLYLTHFERLLHSALALAPPPSAEADVPLVGSATLSSSWLGM